MSGWDLVGRAQHCKSINLQQRHSVWQPPASLMYHYLFTSHVDLRSKAKLSVVVSGEESPTHQGRLAAALRRAEAAEAELARAAAAAGKAAAAPAAEVRRLRAALEASQAEVDMLRSQLAAAERGRSPARSPGGQPGRGLGSQLEEVADEARVQQLEAEVEALQAQLASADAARAQLVDRCAQLERQLNGRQLGATASSAAAQREATEVQAAHLDAARLREEKAVLKEECRRLRREAAGQAAEIEHLTQRLQQLASSRGGTNGGRNQPTSRQTTPDGEPAEGHAEGAAVQQAGASLTAGGLGSPMPLSSARSARAAAAEIQPGSPYSAEGQQVDQGGGSPAAAAATRGVVASPSEADKAAFLREMQHTLHTAERPGVVSRFPHSLGSFLALRGDLQARVHSGESCERACCVGWALPMASWFGLCVTMPCHPSCPTL